MDDRPVSDEVARNRWMAINLVRVAGVAMAIVGLLITQQAIAAPVWLGYALLAVGLLDMFGAPVLLARKWRSPRP